MILRIDCSQPRTIPIPWRPARVLPLRVDTQSATLVVYDRHNYRGREYVLSEFAAITVPQNAEHAEIVVRPGGRGYVDVYIDRGESNVPLPVTRAPRGGIVKAATVEVTPARQPLPSWDIMDGRDVVIMADEANTVPVYVNGWPLEPGMAMMVMPANLADIEVWTETGTAIIRVLAEVKE